ncbi:HAD family phosphatase [Nocardioides marinquilinus]|uniref:HAD family phosphatase n=1 Tax=Nocardioides marinquilinus TaxID=1210400 RepID=A0ABP9P5X1_9ACTN
MVLDLGEVLVRWDPLPALAAGVGEAEARAFLTEFDFDAWNHEQDAGRSFADAFAWLDQHAPRWSRHGRAYLEHFALSQVGEVEGSGAVVRALLAAGVPTFALTNWASETWSAALERFEVLRTFDDVLVSGEVGTAKPDPAIYAMAAERFGHPPSSLFFTDDKPANVEAARAAGWDAEVFTGADALAAALVARGVLDPDWA